MPNFFAKNLIFLREKRNETQAETASALHLSRSTYANYESDASAPKVDVLEKITGHFGVSADELLFADLSNVHLNQKTGVQKKGQNVLLNVHPSVHLNAPNPDIMLSSPSEGPGIHVGMPAVVTVGLNGAENVVFVPVKARAGYLAGYGDAQFIQSLPAYAIPGLHHGTFRAFEVAGHSMFHTLHDSDVVVARWATSADLRDDRVYVVITRNDGVLVKRCIFREGKIIAKSDNNHRGEYPVIVLEATEAVELWYVVQRWTRQLAPPGEIYKRVVDLEAKLSLVEERLRGL